MSQICCRDPAGVGGDLADSEPTAIPGFAKPADAVKVSYFGEGDFANWQLFGEPPQSVNIPKSQGRTPFRRGGDVLDNVVKITHDA